jgi:hypothetical protein
MVDTLHSLRLDFRELLSHLPDEHEPKEKTQKDSLLNIVLRRKLRTFVKTDDHTDTDTDSDDHARLEHLRKAVNDRLSHLEHGLSGGADLATARRMLAQLRKEGMSCLQVGLT